MPIFEDLTQKAVKLTEKTLDKSQELAHTAKKNITIASKESDLKDLYAQLGKMWYEKAGQSECSDETMQSVVNEITQLKETILKLKEENADEKRG